MKVARTQLTTTIALAFIALGLLAGCGDQGLTSSQEAQHPSDHEKERSPHQQVQPLARPTQGARGQAVSTRCPKATVLTSFVKRPGGWRLEAGDPLEGPNDGLPGEAILRKGQRGCAYRSYDRKTFITLVFAAYSPDAADELYAETLRTEQECVTSSLCFQGPSNNANRVGADAKASFVGADFKDRQRRPSAGYIADITGVAQNGAVLCLLAQGPSEGIAPADERSSLGTRLERLNKFLRAACGLRQEASGIAPLAGGPRGAGIHAGAPGRTQDKRGVRTTFVAYTEAIGNHDFLSACALLADAIKADLGGNARCPNELASVFGSFNPSPSQRARNARLAAHARVVIAKNGIKATVSTVDNVTHLLWTGDVWRMNPNPGRLDQPPSSWGITASRGIHVPRLRDHLPTRPVRSMTFSARADPGSSRTRRRRAA